MTWVAVPVPPVEVTAEYLFDLLKKHRLVFENTDLTLAKCWSISNSGKVILVKDSRGGEEIGTVIVSGIVDGEDGEIDFIPISKKFAPIGKDGSRNEEPVMEKLEAVLSPIFRKLIKGRNLRRLSASVPKSRSRAFKALRECGFRKEGVKRNAVKFVGVDAEDVVNMGMLADKE